MSERRVRRSAIRSEALEMMLEACRKRNSLEALLISDEQGMLLAGSSEHGVDLNAVASALPDWPNAPDNQLNAIPFSLEQHCLYVGSIGVLSAISPTLVEAANSAKRILAA